MGGECGAGSPTGVLDGNIYFFSPPSGGRKHDTRRRLLVDYYFSRFRCRVVQRISHPRAAVLFTEVPGKALSALGGGPRPSSSGLGLTTDHGKKRDYYTFFRGAMLPAMSRKKGQKYLVWLLCGAASF